MTIKFRINSREQRRMFKGEMEIRTLSQRQKGKKAWNFTTQRTKRTCKCLLGSVHVCLISSCVVRGCGGGTRGGKSATNSNKKLSPIEFQVPKGNEQRVIWVLSRLIYGMSLQQGYICYWKSWTDSANGYFDSEYSLSSGILTIIFFSNSLCRSGRIFQFTFVWHKGQFIHLFYIFSEITA